MGNRCRTHYTQSLAEHPPWQHGAARAVRELERGWRVCKADELVLLDSTRGVAQLLLTLRGRACRPYPGCTDVDCGHPHCGPCDCGQQEWADRAVDDNRSGAAASAKLAARRSADSACGGAVVCAGQCDLLQ